MPKPWYDWVTWDPQTRLVVNIDTERGDLTRFIVAFDYKLGASWERVARFDHNPEALT